jgi:hypothetical protein
MSYVRRQRCKILQHNKRTCVVASVAIDPCTDWRVTLAFQRFETLHTYVYTYVHRPLRFRGKETERFRDNN